MHDHETFDFVSLSQNGQDVVLNRAFDGKRSGFFVDVGTGDPDRDSVTRNLVDRLSWRGINIEPVPEVHARLESLGILDDVVVTRRVLESDMANVAARLADEATIEQLRGLVDRMDELVDDTVTYHEHDRAFHDAVM